MFFSKNIIFWETLIIHFLQNYKDILEQSIDGRIIVANYKKDTRLNKQLRSKLVDLIITHLMSLFCDTKEG